MSPNEQDAVDAGIDLDRHIIGVAMHGNDFEEGLGLCRKFAEHPNEWVRRAVLEGLSHLARVHKKMDLNFAVPLLVKGLKDKSRLVQGEAEGTLDDFELFLPGFTWEKHGLERPEVSPEFRFDDDGDDGEDETSSE